MEGVCRDWCCRIGAIRFAFSHQNHSEAFVVERRRCLVCGEQTLSDTCLRNALPLAACMPLLPDQPLQPAPPSIHLRPTLRRRDQFGTTILQHVFHVHRPQLLAAPMQTLILLLNHYSFQSSSFSSVFPASSARSPKTLCRSPFVYRTAPVPTHAKSESCRSAGLFHSPDTLVLAQSTRVAT